MALIDIEKAKTITNIEDTELLEFYIDAIVAKIEKYLGYELLESEVTEFATGLNTNNIWLIKKPVVEVLSVCIDDKEIDDKKYKLRNGKNTPHLRFKFNIGEYHEVETTYVAGFTDFNGIRPLNKDIEMFIYSLINSFTGYMEHGDLKSYKIDTISYTYNSWLDSLSEFNVQLSYLFGV